MSARASAVVAVVVVVAVGCATGGGASSGRASGGSADAERGLPAPSALADGAARADYAAARAHEARGDAARGEAAHADWARAGAGYAAVAGAPGTDAWRAPLRLRAAELLLRSRRWDPAIAAAEAVVADGRADDTSRAIAARLAATAALGAAGAAVRAGRLEKLELSPSGAARPPPAAWQRVVDATDAYLLRASADPEARRGPAGPGGGVRPAELALIAAEVPYAYGDLAAARLRLAAVIERWSSEAEVLEQAAPLYLATFARRDPAGHAAALERLRARVAEEAARGTPAQEEGFARVAAALERADAGARLGAAERLLAEGKGADAARELEAIAAEPAAGDPATALHNAAIAWDRAGDAARAATLRERIVAELGDAPVAPENGLSLAAHRAGAGDHAGAARAYAEYLARWPQAPGRCVALRNAAAELDRAGRGAEAAAGYAAFGRDAGCARTEPDVAAQALVRAGALFEAQARAAYSDAAALSGVSDPAAKGLVGEAKRRLGGR